MLPHLKTKQFILNTLHNTFNLPGNTFNQLKLDSLNARPKQDHGVCFDESLQRGGGGGDFFFLLNRGKISFNMDHILVAGQS